MDRWLGKGQNFDDDEYGLRRDTWVCVAAAVATVLLGLWMSID